MATVYLVLRCLVCGYVMEVRQNHNPQCPSCNKAKMSFITTVIKKD